MAIFESGENTHKAPVFVVNCESRNLLLCDTSEALGLVEI